MVEQRFTPPSVELGDEYGGIDVGETFGYSGRDEEPSYLRSDRDTEVLLGEGSGKNIVHFLRAQGFLSEIYPN